MSNDHRAGPASEPIEHPDPTLEEKIRSRAYRLWEDEGRPDGRHQEHWSAAEREVAEPTSPAQRQAL
jgi:hypothetical protein